MSPQPAGMASLAKKLSFNGKNCEVDSRSHARLILNMSASASQPVQVAESYAEMLFQSSPIGLISFRGTGEVLAANAAVGRMVGATAVAVEAQNVLSLPSWKNSGLAELAEAALRSGQPQQATVHHVSTFGRELWMSAQFVPWDHQGEPHLLGLFLDITESKRAEQTHRELEEQLRQAQKMEAVGQLAGGIAHDFNNILAAVMMHLGLLQMNPDLSEEVRLSLHDVQACADRASALTRQLLMFSRRSVLAVKSLDLNLLVTNLLKMLNRLIGEHIELRFESKPGLPPLEADAGMIEQVVMNLVINARDAMPNGGRIRIATSLEEFDGAKLTLHAERRAGSFVCLTVTDTGTGMDRVTLTRIFEPFFTTKATGKGTGLGLATVHGIVAQHKGWIEVESQVDRGTTFQIFFPSSSRRIERESKEAKIQVPRGNETILVVEDELKVRLAVAQALRLLGYHVHQAANGQQAMSLWQQLDSRIDLLLTDMVMPEGITGLELALRLQGFNPGLKVIISSGYSAEMVQAGVPDRVGIVYLPKPYDTAVLAGTVRKCLDEPPVKQVADGAL